MKLKYLEDKFHSLKQTLEIPMKPKLIKLGPITKSKLLISSIEAIPRRISKLTVSIKKLITLTQQSSNSNKKTTTLKISSETMKLIMIGKKDKEFKSSIN